jgi:hypothetical protein
MDNENAMLWADELNKMVLRNDFVTKKTIVNFNKLKDILSNENIFVLIKKKNENKLFPACRLVNDGKNSVNEIGIVLFHLVKQTREVVYYNEIEFLIQCHKNEKILSIPL